MIPYILILILNGQELHLADMSRYECALASNSIVAAGGEAHCRPDTDYEPEPEPASASDPRF